MYESGDNDCQSREDPGDTGLTDSGTIKCGALALISESDSTLSPIAANNSSDPPLQTGSSERSCSSAGGKGVGGLKSGIGESSGTSLLSEATDSGEEDLM